MNIGKEMYQIAQSLEHLRELLGPVAMPGTQARISKDEAFAALSWVVCASDSLRKIAVEVYGPESKPILEPANES